jgi:hypothetical protein
MSDLQSFLGRLIAALEDAGGGYMLTGSMASTLYGRPRSTQDLDVVVHLTTADLDTLLTRLDPDSYYVDKNAARDAIRHQSQFNVIDMATGWKADLIARKRRPFSQSEYHRRERAVVLGVALWVATAEDVIVSKLEWSQKSGGSERQLQDVVGILEQRGPDLDRAYISRWCHDLGLLELWERVAG